MKTLKQKIIFLLYFYQSYTPAQTFKKEVKHLSYNFFYWLLSDFGQASVRKAVGELARTGLVEKIIRNNQAFFRLTVLGDKQFKKIFADFIYQNSQKKGFFLAITRGSKIRQTRIFLENLGFKCLKRGIYLRPAPREFEKSLEPLLGKAFFIFTAKLELTDEKSLTAELWKLDKYYKQGADFVTQAKKLLTKLDSKKRLSKKEIKSIFAISDKFFILIKNTIGLPKNLLPNDWPLPRASNLFSQVLKRVE